MKSLLTNTLNPRRQILAKSSHLDVLIPSVIIA